MGIDQTGPNSAQFRTRFGLKRKRKPPKKTENELESFGLGPRGLYDGPRRPEGVRRGQIEAGHGDERGTPR